MHIQFAELPVVDQERAKKFYTAHLDCRLAADQPMGHDGWGWVELKFAGANSAPLCQTQKRSTRGYSCPRFGGRGRRGNRQDLKSQGVKIITEPHRAPWLSGRIVAEFQDSEGNRMMIGSK